MDRFFGQSLNRPGDGEPALAAAFRRRPRAHTKRFRNQWGPALSSRTAGLSGHSICGEKVEHEGDAQDDAPLQHLPSVYREPLTARVCGDRPEKPTAVAHELDSVGG